MVPAPHTILSQNVSQGSSVSVGPEGTMTLKIQVRLSRSLSHPRGLSNVPHPILSCSVLEVQSLLSIFCLRSIYKEVRC